ncbi:MAG TPA: hypothetical protein VF678_15270 [bacterium]
MSHRYQSVRTAVLVLAVAVGLMACALQPVRIDGSADRVAKLNSIAIVQFEISPPILPLFPLIDAAIFNKNFDSIAPQVLELHQSKVESYSDSFDKTVRRYAGTGVLDGRTLRATPAYHQATSVSRFPNTLTNSRNSSVTLPNGGELFIDTAALEYPHAAFEREYVTQHKEIGQNMSQLASALNVDGVMLVTTGVTASAGIFGAYGLRNLTVNVLVFDRSGALLVAGRSLSPFTNGTAADLNHYMSTLAEFDSITDQLLRQMYGVSATVQGTQPTSSGVSAAPATR